VDARLPALADPTGRRAARGDRYRRGTPEPRDAPA
jgi:hypothetical protein